MTDILWAVFEICVNFCESFIIFYFICNFIKHDFKTPKGKITYVLASILSAAVTTIIDHITVFDWWESFVNIAYELAISCVLFNGKFIVKLFAASLAAAVSAVSGNFVTGVLSVALKSPPELLYTSQGVRRVLGCIIFLTLKLFLFSLILKFTNKTIFALKNKECLLIITVLLISTLSSEVIQAALNETKLSEMTTLMLMICEIGLFTLNIICLYIMISLNKSNRAAEDLKLKEQQHEHSVQYAETVRGQYEEIRGIRHDIKQHLSVVGGLLLEEKCADAQKYISEISSNIAEIEMFMDVGNDFVNAILNSKLSIAKSKGIEVLCNLSGNVEGINEYDLCNLIGNMLDNAIESAEKNNSGSIVEVSIFSDKYKLIITISNSISRSVLSDNSELKTTKNDSGSHGFGVKSIRSIAQKYDGIVDFYEENMTFFCRVILGKNEE